MIVLLASSNPHKAAEFRRIFQGSRISVRTPQEAGLVCVDAPETGITFYDNAMIKAEAYAQAYRMTTLADDSGIRVDGLAGAPGVFSARFGRPDFDDGDRVRYLLACMAGIPEARRGAHYECDLVLALPGAARIHTRAAWYGLVAIEISNGATGFGYDPVFNIPSLGKTVADLTPAEKDALSHRGKAARKLLALLGPTISRTGTLGM